MIGSERKANADGKERKRVKKNKLLKEKNHFVSSKYMQKMTFLFVDLFQIRFHISFCRLEKAMFRYIFGL